MTRPHLERTRKPNCRITHLSVRNGIEKGLEFQPLPQHRIKMRRGSQSERSYSVPSPYLPIFCSRLLAGSRFILRHIITDAHVHLFIRKFGEYEGHVGCREMILQTLGKVGIGNLGNPETNRVIIILK